MGEKKEEGNVESLRDYHYAIWSLARPRDHATQKTQHLDPIDAPIVLAPIAEREARMTTTF